MKSIAVSFVLAALAGGCPALLPAQDVAWARIDPPPGIGTATFTPDPRHQFASAGGLVTASRTSPGANRFEVVLPGTAPGSGVCHATAIGGNHTAVVAQWNPLGSDLIATVDLYDALGNPLTAGAFTVGFRRGGAPDCRAAYLWANNATAGSYVPATTYSWNGNRPDPHITRITTGNYRVWLPGLGSQPSGELGHVQVTPYGTTCARAMVSGWGPAGADLGVTVRTFDAQGAPIDSRFTLSYHESEPPVHPEHGTGAHVWANDATATHYVPNANYAASNGRLARRNQQVIDRLNVGYYRVHLPDVPFDRGSTVQVTAYGNNGHFAFVDEWGDDDHGGTFVYVATCRADGTRADNRFTLRYLTALPAFDVAWAWIDPLGHNTTFTPSTLYQYTPTGELLTVARDPTQSNRFEVTIPGVGSHQGIVHLSPYGGSHVGVVNSIDPHPTGARVWLEIFTLAGNPAPDAAFCLYFRRGGTDELEDAYVHTDQPTTALYHAANPSTRNHDRGAPRIARPSQGAYYVDIPGFTWSNPPRGHFLVTPVGRGYRRAHVQNQGYLLSGHRTATVICHDAAGAVDSELMVSFERLPGPISRHLGSGALLYFDGNYPWHAVVEQNGRKGAPTPAAFDRLGIGHYRVHLPNLSPTAAAMPTVSAGWRSRPYIDYWTSDGGTGTYVFVRTVDSVGPQQGQPRDGAFHMHFVSDDPATTAAATTNDYGVGCHGWRLLVRNRPILGNRWAFDLPSQPGTVLKFAQFGLAANNLPLAAFGAPGCTQLTSAEAVLLLPAAASIAEVAMPLQRDFLGLALFAQAGGFVPGINTLGLAATQGVRGVIGDH